MLTTPLTELSWAYQLHYYLCFRTHRRHQFFNSNIAADVLLTVVNEICNRHEYHLLEIKTYPDQFRCLVSLRPDQSISGVVQTIKANASRESGFQLNLSTPIWARGFLAVTIGKMRLGAVREYLAQQGEHHGYASRVLPPVYYYRATNPIILRSSHAAFDLHHHLVFATYRRKGVFTSGLGEALSDYWLKVAARRGFAIDQLSVVPDHIHLLMRCTPRASVEECALSLLNNAQHYIARHYPHSLIDDGLNQLWQPSAYAGTCGEVSTSLMKKWLSQ
jgi:putative transposase